MGIVEKIEEIEKEMARTQKNKATEYHLGLLKAKLAKYRAQLLEPEKKGPKGEGFDVMKSGDARVCMIGFPSVGKSTLLSKVTKTESVVGAYEFTTLTAIPGVLEYEGARVQLLDLPGIVQDAAKGRGRGRQVVAVAKTADLILLMIDATKSAEQKKMLETELEAVGIRLNTKPPDVVFKQKTAGGITINNTVKLTKTDERTLRSILQTYKIHNCDVMVREDITTDEFIDVLLGTRKYIPALTVINKVDGVSMETLDTMAREGDGRTIMISCEIDLGLDWLLEAIWALTNVMNRVYTKRRGDQPDLSDPICLRQGATIETVCHGIHRGLASHFKYALVWGKSSKFNPQPQKVGLSHPVQDEDVVSIFTK
uniref:Cytoplasmic protein n=1 Tax=Kwoniella bestiolae CBS 10118 TaxID=1296100 RepID=A0A1B9G768_9TREE|nr:cytoplasmic protein [Kwoniella bestiolae CBS 10118]OCF26853.1 cytoplasmic protein [Kwoniella bestiolae CBS 10118]